MSKPKPRTFVRRRGTTAIPNRTVYDDRLSYAALGLLTVLLARPEGAPSGYRDLMGRGLGEKATQAALRELTTAGYRHQLRAAFGRGQLVTHTVVSEDPMTESEAREWLETTALRAADVAARCDQRKQGKAPGQIMRRVSQHDPSRRDNPPHNSLERVPRVTSLRSVTQGEPNAKPNDEVAELTSMPDWLVEAYQRSRDEDEAVS